MKEKTEEIAEEIAEEVAEEFLDIDEECPCETDCQCHDEGPQEMVEIPPQETVERLSEFFKMFGDATRIKILYVLSKDEMCVCDLASTLGMTSPAISHQLRLLKGTRLITSQRRGKSVYYRLCDQHIQGILQQGIEHMGE